MTAQLRRGWLVAIRASHSFYPIQVRSCTTDSETNVLVILHVAHAGCQPTSPCRHDLQTVSEAMRSHLSGRHCCMIAAQAANAAWCTCLSSHKDNGCDPHSFSWRGCIIASSGCGCVVHNAELVSSLAIAIAIAIAAATGVQVYSYVVYRPELACEPRPQDGCQATQAGASRSPG